ncbi:MULTISPECIES: hypothetical protein [unclassified Paenibacillus]|uniref:hypothetical protein n=1 Tax=unclassified Paenibacillus TaxID=185978 RepID=UPI0016884D5B|nr:MULTISPECIES: hypothetical protein [unclassified Paenibacillus]MDQ0720402.1 hypothetical protein [Paenibacillus sp. W4I10]
MPKFQDHHPILKHFKPLSFIVDAALPLCEGLAYIKVNPFWSLTSTFGDMKGNTYDPKNVYEAIYLFLCFFSAADVKFVFRDEPIELQNT